MTDPIADLDPEYLEAVQEAERNGFPTVLPSTALPAIRDHRHKAVARAAFAHLRAQLSEGAPPITSVQELHPETNPKGITE